MKTFRLNNGIEIPTIGLGTAGLNGETCVNSVRKALEAGYRHIDTADMYGNHIEVRRGIKASGIKREEIFLTTKVPANDLQRNSVLRNCDRYLEELGVQYIDLLLIHWPNRNIPVGETLRAMDKLKEQGKIKTMGVSNFTAHHIEDALKTGYEVTVNQVELHPTLNQKELKDYCDSKNIIIIAYSPLGQGRDLTHPVIAELAEKYGVRPVQVIINWIVGRGIVAIPRSSNPQSVESNLKAADWEMEPSDVERIDHISQEPRFLNPPMGEFGY